VAGLWRDTGDYTTSPRNIHRRTAPAVFNGGGFALSHCNTVFDAHGISEVCDRH
jgi:hypothetical protein